MKFALMMDDCAINSYYIKDKMAYDFNDTPYVYHHAVSPECFVAMQNLPFIFARHCDDLVSDSHVSFLFIFML